MIKKSTELPIPTVAMQRQSEQLRQLIIKKICNESMGSISFADFMQLALYEPQWGYYTAALAKFGKNGDFITAPEISPLFAQCIARQCQQVFADLANAAILEIGAGTGRLAIDLLSYLEKAAQLPTQYTILEVSPTLKASQQALIQQHIPHLFPLVRWIEDWPILPVKGVIIANEVLDALPVHKFFWTWHKIYEMRVNIVKQHFNFSLVESELTKLTQLAQLQQDYFHEVQNYASEVNLGLSNWVVKLSESLQQGLALIIDYGFSAREYYHPDRSQGSLRCYYRHRVHSDPFCLIGLQDITASVDFTLLARSALNAGLTIAGFTSQAAFLINNDLLALLEKCYNQTSPRDSNRQVHLLTSPSEMGELIKVIGLTRAYEAEVRGFKAYNKKASL